MAERRGKKQTRGPDAATSRVEQFKRAVAATVRAMADDGNLEVTFGFERPAQRGNKVHLRAPARNLHPAQIRRIRGEADQIALRLRHHDGRTHHRHLPSSELGRRLYDLAEQTRVEALGARHMSGVRDNLANLLEDQLHEQPQRLFVDDTPESMGEAAALMLRERLTGVPLPDIAEPADGTLARHDRKQGRA